MASEPTDTASPTATPSYPPTSHPSPTSTPTLTDTETVTSPTPAPLTAQPAVQPTVQLLDALSAVQGEEVQAAAAGILQVAQTLPLMIRDDFDVNDYAWPEVEDTFARGIQCVVSLTDGQYRISVQTTASSGPGWCYSTAPRAASNFFLSLETGLLHRRNADIWLYFRYLDDNNFHFLRLHPQQTQTLSWGVRLEGTYIYIIQSAFIPAIDKSEPNTLTLLALSDAHTLYINGRLAAMISNVPEPDTGQIKVGVQLNEADEVEELHIDKFELRGN